MGHQIVWIGEPRLVLFLYEATQDVLSLDVKFATSKEFLPKGHPTKALYWVLIKDLIESRGSLNVFATDPISGLFSDKLVTISERIMRVKKDAHFRKFLEFISGTPTLLETISST